MKIKPFISVVKVTSVLRTFILNKKQLPAEGEMKWSLEMGVTGHRCSGEGGRHHQSDTNMKPLGKHALAHAHAHARSCTHAHAHGCPWVNLLSRPAAHGKGCGGNVLEPLLLGHVRGQSSHSFVSSCNFQMIFVVENGLFVLRKAYSSWQQLNDHMGQFHSFTTGQVFKNNYWASWTSIQLSKPNIHSHILALCKL